MGKRILLVEDDLYLREGLTELLAREGYALACAPSAKEAVRQMDAERFDLVLLDVSLPDGSGIALCKAWRGQGKGVPILFLTARDEELDIVRGLDAGGNDYVTKPFRMLELLSRIRALLRGAQPLRYQWEGLEVDADRMHVRKGDQSVFLTPTEFHLLLALIRNAGRIVPRALLLESIWDDGGQFVDDNTLSVHLSRLREKIGPEWIRTVRGVGYAWAEQPSQSSR